jgi:NTP pyrophosphatase (non-canonical NTP hydrolase)
MTRHEHLMTIAMEECAEVAQRIAKAQRFGMSQIQQDADDKPEENPGRLSNRARIVDELNDLMAMMEMIGISLLDIDGKKMYAKREKVERYLKRSQQCGTLVD